MKFFFLAILVYRENDGSLPITLRTKMEMSVLCLRYSSLHGEEQMTGQKRPQGQKSVQSVEQADRRGKGGWRIFHTFKRRYHELISDNELQFDVY